MIKSRTPDLSPVPNLDRRALLAAECGPPTTAGAGAPWRVALVYPNSYHVGMSSLGFQIALRTINATPGARAERFFTDTMAGGSIERGAPLHDFDLIAFSAAYEMDAPNVLDVLEAAGLPLEARARTADDAWPLVLMGGVLVAVNRLPLYPFIDLFAHGEAELILRPLLRRLLDAHERRLGRAETLQALRESPGLPGLEITAGALAGAGLAPPDGLAALATALDRQPDAAAPLPRPAAPERAVLDRLGGAAAPGDGDSGAGAPFTSHILTPHTEFSNMALVDLARGCPNHCTFCWIGHNAPCYRVRPAEQVLAGVRALEPYTQRFGLVASAVGAHPEIDAICGEMMARGLRVSYSSLRVEEVTPMMLRTLAAGGQKSITLAPEAGSLRVRRLLGKRIRDEQLFDVAEQVFALGVENIKLYFMTGIPSETDEEALEIVAFAERLREVMLRWARPRGRMGSIGINLGIYVPKPGLPLGHIAPAPFEAVKKRLRRVMQRLERVPNTRVAASSPELARAQGILAMSGAEAAHYLLALRRNGGDWRATNRQWLKQPGALDAWCCGNARLSGEALRLKASHPPRP